ncbi:hypothetical protein DHD80_00015 [Gramella sp. AN32]|nr:hypothetical protein [Gramella sp. AN32]
MTVVVLFTTTSFKVDMHFCGNNLVDFSLFHNVQTCGMENEQPTNTCEKGFSKKPCCSDKQLVIEGQHDFKTSLDKLAYGHYAFVATFFSTYINLFDELDNNVIRFKDYSPPFLERDIQILDQVFLI